MPAAPLGSDSRRSARRAPDALADLLHHASSTGRSASCRTRPTSSDTAAGGWSSVGRPDPLQQLVVPHLVLDLADFGVGGFGEFIVGIARQQRVLVFQIVLEEQQPLGAAFPAASAAAATYLLARSRNSVGVPQARSLGSVPTIRNFVPTGFWPKYRISTFCPGLSVAGPLSTATTSNVPLAYFDRHQVALGLLISAGLQLAALTSLAMIAASADLISSLSVIDTALQNGHARTISTAATRPGPRQAVSSGVTRQGS